MLARLAELILADTRRRGDLPVALAPGWDLDEDRVRYVRRSVTAGDDTAAVTFETVSDRLFFLRRSGVLERLIALFERHGAVRHADLVAWLAAEERAEPAECETYVGALYDLGMVHVPCLGVHAHTPTRCWPSATLRAVDRPWSARLADGLAGPAAIVARYPRAGLAERRDLLRELRERLRALQTELGAPDATLPQTLLYEDVDAGRRPATREGPTAGEPEADDALVCSTRAWSDPLAPRCAPSSGCCPPST
ncbi:hypothetical protein NKH77_02625 [Streptomyces sp. M19]